MISRRAVEDSLPHVAEVGEEGPGPGQKDADTSRRRLDASGDLDQPHPPSAGVPFTQGVRFSTAIEMAAAVASGEGFRRNRIGVGFCGRRCRDLLPQRDQHLVRQTRQEHPKAVGHVTMIAQPIRAQFALKFLVAILAFTAFGVFVISALRQSGSPRSVGHNGTTIRALRIRFALHHHPPRRGPRLGPVPEAREQPLRLAARFPLLQRDLQLLFHPSDYFLSHIARPRFHTVDM